MPPIPASPQVRDAAADAVKAWTSPFVAAIYGARSDGTGDLIGSGTYLRVNGKLALLTAAHVIHKGWEDYAAIARRSGPAEEGQSPKAVVVPEWSLSSPDLDLAVAIIGIDKAITPATMDVVGTTSADVNDNHLFIHGFPQAQSAYLALANGVNSISLPYMTQTHHSTWSGFDPNKHFAIEFPASAIQQWAVGKGLASLPDGEGLSGSAVWRLAQDLTTWTDSSTRLVGVVHRWDHKRAQSLAVTRIEQVNEFILEVLRRRFARSQWEARGCRHGCASEDWRVAEETVKVLR